MRYWTILAAKCALAVAVLYAVWAGMHDLYTPPAHIVRWGFSPFLHDLKWTSMVFAFFLLCQAAIFLIVRDLEGHGNLVRKLGDLLAPPVPQNTADCNGPLQVEAFVYHIDLEELLRQVAG